MSDDPVIKSWAITAQSVRAEIFHVPPEDMRRIFQHIEQLTADRYATLARLADAVAREINLTAERDRLREALECLEIAATGVGVPHPQERKLLHEAIADARAALKGDSHE